MIRFATEKELLDSFRDSDREEVELPEGLRFPLVVRDYLSWVQPAGARVFLVFAATGSRMPLGVVFRRDQGPSLPPSMCEWCHSVRGGEGVGMLTARASSRRRVGILLCRDLSCKSKVDEAPGADDFPQAGDSRERIRRIVQRMSDFARQSLF